MFIWYFIASYYSSCGTGTNIPPAGSGPGGVPGGIPGTGGGFWTGAATGGVLGYLFGSRNNQGTGYYHRQQPYNGNPSGGSWFGAGNNPPTGGGWFAGSGGSSAWNSGSGTAPRSTPSNSGSRITSGKYV